MQSLIRLARPILSNSKPLSTAVSRTFTTLSPPRPSLTPLRRPAALTSFTPASMTVADVVPVSAVSAHPALAGLQLRFGPRNTMNGHTRLVQKRRHGFLYRMKTKTGRRILHRRRMKGRRHVAW